MHNYITLEFSLSQKAFHRSNLIDLAANNASNCWNRKQTDYVLIGVFETEKECDEWKIKHENTLKDYSMFKSFNGEVIVLQ